MLVTEFGRYDRAAVIIRAKELHRSMEWGAAVTQSWREAAAELRARFNRHSTIAASRVKAA